MSVRDKFIRAVAEYLTSDVGRKSIALEAGNADAIKWAQAYRASGCRGYATAEEAEQAIRFTLAELAESGVAK